MNVLYLRILEQFLSDFCMDSWYCVGHKYLISHSFLEKWFVSLTMPIFLFYLIVWVQIECNCIWIFFCSVFFGVFQMHKNAKFNCGGITCFCWTRSLFSAWIVDLSVGLLASILFKALTTRTLRLGLCYSFYVQVSKAQCCIYWTN